MTNVFQDFEQRITNVLQALPDVVESGADVSRLTVEPPRDLSHGDLATNAAMILAKPMKTNPRALAATIAAELEKDADVASVEIAGPGFINLRLVDGFWSRELTRVLTEGRRYGADATGNGKKVNVEYVSANPTGPMHVGHCRGAVVGDAMANLLEFAGYDVVREYYTNDAGGQIDVLARSAFLRYREALGQDIGKIPEGLYPGEYLKPLGQSLVDAHGDALLTMDESDMLAIVRPAAIDAMMDLIRADLAALGVHHDVFFSERSLHAGGEQGSAISKAVNRLTDMGLVYTGTLPPPKGTAPEDWEDREQLLFRSTDVGDDMDRALQKSSGDYTYFAADVGYFQDKFDRGFEEMVFVLGADHGGYVKRMEALGKAISEDTAKVTIRLCQLVKLFRDGEPVTMSKRSGNFITLREVVDEVGRDAVRFMMLYRKNDAPLDFDFAKVKEQSRDNPIFYVQYAHARCHSVLRQAARDMPNLDISADALRAAKTELLLDDGEDGLMRKLAEYPRVIDAAARSQEPHRLSFYLYDLAALLHGQWNKGRDDVTLRFIHQENPELTLARLGLVTAVSEIIASGLAIIGADAPQEMR
ncbi:arginine--tRNA ligase [Ahrensia sp. R2A130]|uniref:arginine--tRNA ligase n=1 Tax=Ahrensia sp. R2A130 TaxID=744979 RepID=UPI0001E0E85E|nr:arginine--tRNA ligase [Ahrensia sp. R2A130]EFL90388.1 arginyl-tRNA synthetase [Ahrensia sp. R2A130]